MRRLLLALAVLLVTAAPAAAAPGWTSGFGLAGPPAGQPAMAPDGTIVFPVSIYVNPTYVPEVQVRPPGGPIGDKQPIGGYPTVRAGGDGRIVAAWVESNDVHVANLMPGASSLGSSVTLEPTADTAKGATLDVDAAGNATVLWWTLDDNGGGGTVARMRSTTLYADGRAPYTQLLEETSAPAGTTLGYETFGIDVNASGQAIAYWMRTETTAGPTTNRYLRAARRPVDSPFDPSSLLDQGVLHTPSVDTDSNFGNVTIAINDAGAVGVFYFHGYYDSTFPYTPPDVNYFPGNVEVGFGPVEHALDGPNLWVTTLDMALDRDGRAIVAGRGLITGKVRPVVAFRPPGGPFSAQTAIEQTGPQSSDNELAAAPNGDILLLYSVYGTTGSVSAVVAARGASSFGTPQPLGTGFDSIQSLLLAFGSSGDAVAAWSYQSGSDFVGTAFGYDASPPVLRNLVIPTSGTAGSPLDFSVQPVDIWSPVTTTWAFGDGANADGTSASHAYAAGDFTASVTATDSLGNAASESRPVSVAPAPVQQPVVVPETPAPDKTPPLVSGFAASPSVFAVGSKSTPLVAKVVRGTKFRFTLSEAGSAAITIARQIPGRRSGKSCVPATKKLRKTKACKAYKRVGTLTRKGSAGANSVAFTGKLGRRALGVARYRATVVVTDAAGNKSVAKSTAFRIVPAR